MNKNEEYYCINCGRKLIFEFLNGKARIQCTRCKGIMVVKYKSHKCKLIEAYR